jgi:hypothetical protein
MGADKKNKKNKPVTSLVSKVNMTLTGTFTKKQMKVLQMNNNGKGREVLLICHSSLANWSGISRRFNLSFLTVRLVRNHTEVLTVIREYIESGVSFHTIVLAPCHGSKEEATVKWGASGVYTQLYPVVVAALPLSAHVHISTCYQGFLFLFFASIH